MKDARADTIRTITHPKAQNVSFLLGSKASLPASLALVSVIV